LTRENGLIAAQERGSGGDAVDLDRAYAHCEAVTRQQAANFFYGIRLLPRARRRAISAVYAFARRIDDVGDGPLEPAQKLRLLAEQAEALQGLQGGAPAPSGDPVMAALRDAHNRYPIPRDALPELIAGVRMDVEGTEYERFDELLLYCRRVAGGIGRVCLAIFGKRAGVTIGDRDAERLADELGVAMQLTNILRDMREDALNGRVYVPADDLRRFGVAERAGDPRAMLGALDAAGGREASADVAGLVRFEAARAREWFERGVGLIAVLDRRSAASVLAMSGIYRRLLDRIDSAPEQAARRRMSLPAREKAWVAARGMLRGAA
jgi:15-cis-phytoene synthase